MESDRLSDPLDKKTEDKLIDAMSTDVTKDPKNALSAYDRAIFFDAMATEIATQGWSSYCGDNCRQCNTSPSRLRRAWWKIEDFVEWVLDYIFPKE
jgi:hypothetical protein